MIIARLKGGLGNQMLQYAAGLSLAHRLGSKFFIDLSWFDYAKDIDAPRHYELACFNLSAQPIRPSRFALTRPGNSLKISAYKYTKGLIKPRVGHFIEKNDRFDKEFFKLPDNTLIEGFFADERYFKDTRDLLLADFSFKNPPSGQNKRRLAEIEKTDSVSIHVRRGDYANIKATRDFHGLLGTEYYKNAINNITKKVKSPHFFIFSDEPAWCKKNLKPQFPTTYISGNKAGFEDLRLMQNCKHNIIANSSFSWWGAWLNQNPDKMVIAPKKWFRDPSMDAAEIVPKNWIRL